jgi:deazaflavin-dependent oxidoreductase (nitroreductase family)
MRIPNRIRYFNKRVLNKGMIKIAGRSHSPISIVRHVGRRSGKTYATPVIIMPLKDGFVFALTYGTQVDWYRNVLEAGHCQVRWHGQDYALERPEPMVVKDALRAFPQPFRLILGMLNLQDFFRMRFSPVEPIRQHKN